MKHISLRLMLTLWFAVLIAAVGAFTMVLLTDLAGEARELDMRGVLVYRLRDARDALETPNVSDDLAVLEEFLATQDGVRVAAYRSDGTCLRGSLPADIAALPFRNAVLRVQDDSYVYDYYVNSRDVWLRGCCSRTVIFGVVSALVRSVLLALPVLVVLGAALGLAFCIVNLRQLRGLQREIDEIATGEDLSRRIAVKNASSEVTHLAGAFNSMMGRLENSFQAEQQFTANASHEMRTPAAVILAACECALEEPHTEAEYRETLEIVQRQTQRLSATVGRLLRFTRLAQGTERLETVRIDLGELARTVTAEFSARAPEIAWTAAAEPVFVLADVTLLTHLLENLLDNARKFGAKQITVTVAQTDGLAVLAVRDDGIGIAPAEQKRIWDYFYQADPSRSGNGSESCGVGLALVRQIAVLHGGSVTLESAVGAGSTFTFRMPCAE